MQTGTRVRVWNGDQSEELGLGTYEGEASVKMLFVRTKKGLICYSDWNDPTADVDPPPGSTDAVPMELLTPKIRLDKPTADGRGVIYGCQCWWEPAE